MGKPPSKAADGQEPPALPIGEEYNFKVIKISEEQKRIGLSLRAVTEDDERSRLQDYSRQAVAATSIIRNAIKQQKWIENQSQHEGTGDDQG